MRSFARRLCHVVELPSPRKGAQPGTAQVRKPSAGALHGRTKKKQRAQHSQRVKLGGLFRRRNGLMWRLAEEEARSEWRGGKWSADLLPINAPVADCPLQSKNARSAAASLVQRYGSHFPKVSLGSASAMDDVILKLPHSANSVPLGLSQAQLQAEAKHFALRLPYLALSRLTSSSFYGAEDLSCPKRLSLPRRLFLF